MIDHLLESLAGIGVSRVLAVTSAAPPDLRGHAGPHRFREAGREAGPALDVVAVSRAAVFGDYDNNGSVDILVVNLNAAPTLLRNGAPAGGTANWLMVLAAGGTSNTGGIGAVITLEAGERT